MSKNPSPHNTLGPRSGSLDPDRRASPSPAFFQLLMKDQSGSGTSNTLSVPTNTVTNPNISDNKRTPPRTLMAAKQLGREVSFYGEVSMEERKQLADYRKYMNEFSQLDETSFKDELSKYAGSAAFREARKTIKIALNFDGEEVTPQEDSNNIPLVSDKSVSSISSAPDVLMSTSDTSTTTTHSDSNDTPIEGLGHGVTPSGTVKRYIPLVRKPISLDNIPPNNNNNTINNITINNVNNTTTTTAPSIRPILRPSASGPAVAPRAVQPEPEEEKAIAKIPSLTTTSLSANMVKIKPKASAPPSTVSTPSGSLRQPVKPVSAIPNKEALNLPKKSSSSPSVGGAASFNTMPNRSSGSSSSEQSKGSIMNGDVWKEYYSNTTGKKYYYNTVTKKTTWERPSVTASFYEADPVTPNTTSAMTSSASQSDKSTMKRNEKAVTPSVSLDPQRSAHNIRKPTSGLPERTVSMETVDGSVKKFKVTDDFTIKDLIHLLAEKLDLWQTDFFQFSAVSPDGKDRWLRPSNTLTEERIGEQTRLVLKVKHLKKIKKLIDPVAVHLIYLQIQQNVVNDNYCPPDSLAIRLASIQMLVSYGPYEPTKHVVGFFDKDSILKFLPPSILQNNLNNVEVVEKRILSLYATLCASPMKPIEAELKYLEISSKIPLYNSTIFEVKEGIQRKLAIVEDGFLISRKENKELFDFYSFDEIAGWNQTAAGVQIRISNPDKKPLFDLITAEGATISELLADLYTLLLQQQEAKKKKLKLKAAIPIEVPLFDLPDWRLFEVPKKKKKLMDAYFSRLELFKFNYAEGCKGAPANVISWLIHSINSALDKDVTLDALDLSNCGLDAQKTGIIAKALSATFQYQSKNGFNLKENFNPIKVDLSRNIVPTIEMVMAVGKLLECPVAIKSLSLRAMKLGIKGVQELTTALQINRTINELNVAENDLTNKGVAFIVGAIKDNRNYVRFNFSRNQLDEKVADALIELLQKNGRVEELVLAGNKIGDAAVLKIVACLKRLGEKSLESLNLSETGLEGDFAKEFYAYISQSIQLKNLVLSKNKLPEKFVASLGAQIMKNPLHKLAKLDLRFCDIPSKSLSEICSGVAGNRRIEELHLSGNTLKKKTGTALVDALGSASSLKILSLRGCSLTKQTLIGLMPSVRSHPSLIKLDISNNSDVSSSEVVKEIEELLKFSKKLEEINLSSCGISGSGLISLSSSVAVSLSLKRIHLDGNKLGKNLFKFAEAANSNKNIEKISARKSDVSKKDAQLFFTTLNPSALHLKEVLLQLNELNKKDLEMLKQFPGLKVFV